MVAKFLHSFVKNSVVKIVLAVFLLGSLSCSDEFKRDTNLYVSVVGAGIIPSYHSGSADRETPSTLTLEVSQVVLVTADEMSNISSGSEPAALSMLTTEQKDVFEIFDREKRVYFKSLDDTLSNVTYGRVEVYFKLYDSVGNPRLNVKTKVVVQRLFFQGMWHLFLWRICRQVFVVVTGAVVFATRVLPTFQTRLSLLV